MQPQSKACENKHSSRICPSWATIRVLSTLITRLDHDAQTGPAMCRDITSEHSCTLGKFSSEHFLLELACSPSKVCFCGSLSWYV